MTLEVAFLEATQAVTNARLISKMEMLPQDSGTQNTRNGKGVANMPAE